MDARTQLNAIIRTHVHPLLRRNGFARRGTTWNRKTGILTQLIQLQLSQWNSRDDVAFTVNVAVSALFVDHIVWQAFTRKVPDVAGAIVNVRVGRLGLGGHYLSPPQGGDEWWELDMDSAMDAVAASLVDALSARAVPFLDHLRTPEAVLTFLCEHPDHTSQLPLVHINRAVLLAQLGRTEDARAVLAEVMTAGGDWGDRAALAAGKLHIDVRGNSPDHTS